MKPFLDLLDTELELELMLAVRPIGLPRINISINNQVVYSGALDTALKLRQQLPLLDPFSIKIELVEKDYMALHETAAVVEQLSIDDFELVPRWTQLFEYTNDHDYHDPTNYLGFVGTWTLTVDQPFYQWRHRVTGQGLLLTLDQ